MNASHWPNTPCPDTAQWASRCKQELLRQDALIPEREAAALAADMSTGEHWRRQEPEAAAVELFGPTKTYTSW